MYPKGINRFFKLKMQLQLYLFFSMIQLGISQPCNNVTFRDIEPGLTQVMLDWFVTHPTGTQFEIELTRISPSPAGNPSIIQTTSKPFVITDLLPGTEYSTRIRAICPNSSSNWSSPFRFTTFLLNSDNCGLGLNIQLNNCNNNRQIFNILVDDASGNLGQDVELLSLNLLIEHNRPDDLDIRLISPAGKEVQVIKNYGLQQNNLGNVDATDCGQPLIFTPLSCIILDTQGIPLRDSVQPFESFQVFHDTTSAAGVWKLSVCDRHNDDRGRLISAKLVFHSDLCTPPRSNGILDVNGNSALISIVPSINCVATILEFVPDGKLPGSTDQPGDDENILIEIACGQETALVEMLSNNTEYTIYTRSKCNSDSYSINTCGQTFSTLCTVTALQSDFDELINCSEDCGQYCVLDNIWYNDTEQALQWVVNQGPTPTANTGPDKDFYGLGSYIYIASSNPGCVSTSPANLLSECIQIGSLGDGCAMQFRFHQFGNQIGNLILEITRNAGSQWDTIFFSSGNLGNEWQTANISLQEYSNSTVQFRFSGLPLGPRGNVALDEIVFFGDIKISSEEFVYYADIDVDGFGSSMDSIINCFSSPPDGFVANHADCDDTNPNINPNMDEIPCNLIDDNCSGVIDDAMSDLRIVSTEVIVSECVGISEGAITLVIEGGIAPYTVIWSNLGTGQSISNLPDGFYQATISDSNNCIILSDSILVESIQNLSTLITESEESTCEGIADGRIKLETSGGTTPYSYQWNDGGVSNNRQDLLPGIYKVTITDDLGCEQIFENITVEAGQAIDVELLELRNPKCFNVDDGQIRVKAAGDPTLYEYLWSTQESGPTARFLSAGTYTVSVTNIENLCTTTKSYELEAPDPLKVEIIALDPVSCPGGNTGRIIIEASGGVPGYTYIWNSDSFQSFNRNLNEIAAGEYTVILTDSRNCNETFGPFTIEEPSEFQIVDSDITHNRCLLGDQGTINLTIEGGTPEYQYFWSNGSLEASQDSLFNGFYILTITDELACRKIFSAIEITSTNAPLESDIVQLSGNQCHGDRNGQIVVQVNDGVAPYEFHWSTGRKLTKPVSLDTISGLLKGNYGLTITDLEGCNTMYNSISVNGPQEPLSYNLVEMDPVRCFGESNGRIRIQGLGGIPPYDIIWSNGDSGTTVEALSAGIYDFTMIDQNDCIYESPLINLSEPPSLEIIANIFEEEACTDGLSRINVIVDGGEAPYDINWIVDGDIINASSLTNLYCGDYQMMLMDFRGCTLDTTFRIGSVSTGTPEVSPVSIRISPNPYIESFIIDLVEPSRSGKIQIDLFNTIGVQVYSTQLNNLPARITPSPQLPPGSYFIRITYDGKVSTKMIFQH